MTHSLPPRQTLLKAALAVGVPLLTAAEVYLRLALSGETQRLFAVLGLVLYACLFGALLWKPTRWWAFGWCVGVILPLGALSRWFLG